MSYDLLLYRREFLRDALAQSRGDWTSAPALPSGAPEWLQNRAQAAGFSEQLADPGFVEFAKSQGHKVGREFLLSGTQRTAQLTIFENSASFSVPGNAIAPMESVAFCLELGREAARELSLGLYDPQSGEVYE